MAARHKNLFKLKPIRWLMKRKWGRKLLFMIFGKKKDNPRGWPTHFAYIHKTDEERCENIPWVLKIEDPLIVTEKLDGTSCTYILEKKKNRFGKTEYEFYVLSRNIRQQDENQKTYHDHNIYWDLAFKYDIENKLKGFLDAYPECTYVCIQGEGVGSVQANPLKLEEDDLYVFNFIDSINGRFTSTLGKTFIEKMGMKWVPILDTDYHMPDNMEDFKKYADGPSAVNPKVKREGVVIRNPKTDFSFKNVSREYLLKHNQ
jgi:RNA ligase (TIGR02306 family)